MRWSQITLSKILCSFGLGFTGTLNLQVQFVCPVQFGLLDCSYTSGNIGSWVSVDIFSSICMHYCLWWVSYVLGSLSFHPVSILSPWRCDCFFVKWPLHLSIPQVKSEWPLIMFVKVVELGICADFWLWPASSFPFLFHPGGVMVLGEEPFHCDRNDGLCFPAIALSVVQGSIGYL